MITPVGESCSNCKFFFQSDPDRELNRQTGCRRYPPVGQTIQGPRGVGTIGFFTPTQPGFWCGEWALDSVIVKQ